jgi:hypothetical protein
MCRDLVHKSLFLNILHTVKLAAQPTVGCPTCALAPPDDQRASGSVGRLPLVVSKNCTSMTVTLPGMSGSKVGTALSETLVILLFGGSQLDDNTGLGGQVGGSGHLMS